MPVTFSVYPHVVTIEEMPMLAAGHSLPVIPPESAFHHLAHVLRVIPKH
jgi:hypothetical protein